MDKYVAAEQELAQLAGFSEIRESLFQPDSLASDSGLLPKWARDDAAAFQLAYEHSINVEWDDDEPDDDEPREQPKRVFAYSEGNNAEDVFGPTFVIELLADHPDKGAAARLAIVKARIAQIKEGRK